MADAAVKGLKEVLDVLTQLGPRIERQALSSGMRAGGNVVRDEARLRAPKRTGKMAKAIVTGSPRKNQDGTYSVRVYVDERKPNGFLGIFHEYGVAPHFISAGDSDKSPRILTRAARRGDVTGDVATGALKIGDNFVVGTIMHPGHSAHPFMRPALDAKQTEVVNAIRAKIVEVVEKKTGFNINAGMGMDEAA